MNILVPGVLITGGPNWPVGVGDNVEVFNLHTKKSCRLADLPDGKRHGHSFCGRLLCGGDSEGLYSSTQRSCLMLNPLSGDFTSASVSLSERRSSHLCWDVDGGNGPILLIGGSFSPRSTELVSSDGLSSSTDFTLTYDTR